MRKHNRFSTDISVECKFKRQIPEETEYLQDISVDGLCFSSNSFFAVGRIITLKISVIKPVLQVKARVVWCQQNGSQFYIGVQFMNVENGSCIRTVEFLQFLDQYRRNLFMNEGRKLTCEQAYFELMSKKPYHQMATTTH